MFIKTAISFIVAHILLLGGTNTRVYIAPDNKQQIATSTIKQTLMPTTTKEVGKAVVAKENTKTTKKLDKPAVKKPLASSTPIVIQTPEPAPDFEAINTFARQAIVNILCTTKGGELYPISGTGVIVEPNGLILTNAHIGQYFLLRDFKQKDFIQCVARTGSPAYPKYNLELVYISPTWVSENKAQLKDEKPKGTGENDFAFLRITKTVDDTNLPDKFPFVTMNLRENIQVDEPVLLVSYPAGFLGGLSIQQNLNVTSAITKIQDVFTFKDGTIDIISVGGTVVSQKGSSGGMVVDKKSTLIGIITTSSDGDTTSARGLNAITLAYIARDLESELKINLLQFLSTGPEEFAKTFASTTAPTLTKLLTDELTKQ